MSGTVRSIFLDSLPLVTLPRRTIASRASPARVLVRLLSPSHPQRLVPASDRSPSLTMPLTARISCNSAEPPSIIPSRQPQAAPPARRSQLDRQLHII